MKPSLQQPLPYHASTNLSLVKRGGIWEKNVYLGIEEHLQQKPAGYAHHMIQQIIHGRISRPQIIDILVDNADGHYFGIECKTSFNGDKGIYITRWRASPEQFSKEVEFLARANRIGVVAFLVGYPIPEEDRMQYSAYLIPFAVCENLLLGRKTTIALLDELSEEGFIYKIATEDGRVHFTDDVFGRLAEMEDLIQSRVI